MEGNTTLVRVGNSPLEMNKMSYKEVLTPNKVYAVVSEEVVETVESDKASVALNDAYVELDELAPVEFDEDKVKENDAAVELDEASVESDEVSM
jgi:hypothetical protein